VITYIGELDVDVASVSEYRELTMRWLRVMSRAGCPREWSAVEAGETLATGRGDSPGAPWGPPGTTWGRWRMSRVADPRDVDLTSEKPHGALRHSERTLTARTFARDLPAQLADPPIVVAVDR